MRGRPGGFWGKLQKDDTGEVVEWHPLEDHCADVAACTEVLLGMPVLRGALARLGGLEDLTAVQRARLCVLAALHDAGKFNLGFQRKAQPTARAVAGHVAELAALLSPENQLDFTEPARLAAALGLDGLLQWAADEDAALALLLASVAHHGKPVVDGREGRALPGFEVLWNDDERERFRFRGWAAERPKRFLAGAVVVGTIDQVLLSALMVSHAHLRATALLRHLLVVDEVHASDSYMNRLLEEVLRRHLAAGGQALLMSATLGSTARLRLLHPDSRPPPVSLAEACATPYPALTHRTSSGATRQAIAPDGRSKRVLRELAPLLEDAAGIAARALDAARRGARRPAAAWLSPRRPSSKAWTWTRTSS